MDRFIIFALGVGCALAWNAFIFLRARRSIVARALVAHGALLIDARSEIEFAGGHLAEATSVVPETIVTLGNCGAYRSGRDLDIAGARAVLYSRTHAQSRLLAQCLRDAGARLVFDLGVMSNW